MATNWVGILVGVLVMLVGLVQAWRPGDAVQMNNKYTMKAFRRDPAQDLWLIRLVGVIAALVGLGVVTGNLWSA